MGIAGLIVLPILMLLGKSIIAKIYAFSFWFQRIILPERDAPQPIDTPQTAQDVEKLLDTPWWDAFWAYQNRSFRLAFIIEAAVAFLFFFLLNLSIGSMVDMRLHTPDELVPGGEAVLDCNSYIQAIGIAMA